MARPIVVKEAVMSAGIIRVHTNNIISPPFYNRALIQRWFVMSTCMLHIFENISCKPTGCNAKISTLWGKVNSTPCDF